MERDDGLSIRRARWSDAPAVVGLVKALAGDMTDRAARRRFRRLVTRPSYIVLVASAADGRVAGIWAAREGHFLAADRPYLQTIGLSVDPDFSGLGVGAQLIEAGSRNSFHCQHWVTTTHEELHDYYERLGFRRTGVRFQRVIDERAPLPAGRSLARRLFGFVSR